MLIVYFHPSVCQKNVKCDVIQGNKLWPNKYTHLFLVVVYMMQHFGGLFAIIDQS